MEQPPPPTVGHNAANNLIAAEQRLADLDGRLIRNDEEVARIRGSIAALDAAPMPDNDAVGHAAEHGDGGMNGIEWEAFFVGFLAGLMFWLYFWVSGR